MELSLGILRLLQDKPFDCPEVNVNELVNKIPIKELIKNNLPTFVPIHSDYITENFVDLMAYSIVNYKENITEMIKKRACELNFNIAKDLVDANLTIDYLIDIEDVTRMPNHSTWSNPKELTNALAYAIKKNRPIIAKMIYDQLNLLDTPVDPSIVISKIGGTNNELKLLVTLVEDDPLAVAAIYNYVINKTDNYNEKDYRLFLLLFKKLHQWRQARRYCKGKTLEQQINIYGACFFRTKWCVFVFVLLLINFILSLIIVNVNFHSRAQESISPAAAISWQISSLLIALIWVPLMLHW